MLVFAFALLHLATAEPIARLAAQLVAARCGSTAIVFADSSWRALALETARELVRFPGNQCAVLWLWSCAPSNATFAHPRLIAWRECARAAGGEWGSRSYFAQISQRVPRLAALAAALPRSAVHGVSLIDADVAVFRNVLARFERSNRTFVGQRETPCASEPSHSCANGGVYWVRRSVRGRRLLWRVAHLMRALGIPDQDALDIALAAPDCDALYLDALRYANGHTMQYDADFDVARAHLVHANWLRGLRAKERALAHVRRTAPV